MDKTMRTTTRILPLALAGLVIAPSISTFTASSFAVPALIAIDSESQPTPSDGTMMSSVDDVFPPNAPTFTAFSSNGPASPASCTAPFSPGAPSMTWRLAAFFDEVVNAISSAGVMNSPEGSSRAAG